MPTNSLFRRVLPIFFIATVVVAGCSSSSFPSELGGITTQADPVFAARVNGVDIIADANSATASYSDSGQLVIDGGKPIGSSHELILLLYAIQSTGTYPLGVDATLPGGMAFVYDSSSAHGWASPLSGAAGSITITKLTRTRIVGVFSFTANPSSPSSTGSKVVESGTFDLPITSDPIPARGWYGGKFATTAINGVPFAPAHLALQEGVAPDSSLVMQASNLDYAIVLTIGSFGGPGTYVLNLANRRTATVLHLTRDTPSAVIEGWGGTVYGGTGSVTITTVSATRIQGSFLYVLVQGAGQTTPLTISGSFDFGRGARTPN